MFLKGTEKRNTQRTGNRSPCPLQTQRNCARAIHLHPSASNTIEPQGHIGRSASSKPDQHPLPKEKSRVLKTLPPACNRADTGLQKSTLRDCRPTHCHNNSHYQTDEPSHKHMWYSITNRTCLHPHNAHLKVPNNLHFLALYSGQCLPPVTKGNLSTKNIWRITGVPPFSLEHKPR